MGSSSIGSAFSNTSQRYVNFWKEDFGTAVGTHTAGAIGTATYLQKEGELQNKRRAAKARLEIDRKNQEQEHRIMQSKSARKIFSEYKNGELDEIRAMSNLSHIGVDPELYLKHGILASSEAVEVAEKEIRETQVKAIKEDEQKQQDYFIKDAHGMASISQSIFPIFQKRNHKDTTDATFSLDTKKISDRLTGRILGYNTIAHIGIAPSVPEKFEKSSFFDSSWFAAFIGVAGTASIYLVIFFLQEIGCLPKKQDKLQILLEKQEEILTRLTDQEKILEKLEKKRIL